MSEKLTGKRRYRADPGSWVRNPTIVLQVEITFLHTYWSSGMVDCETVTTWRDARTSDLTEHEVVRDQK